MYMYTCVHVNTHNSLQQQLRYLTLLSACCANLPTMAIFLYMQIALVYSKHHAHADIHTCILYMHITRDRWSLFGVIVQCTCTG